MGFFLVLLALLLPSANLAAWFAISSSATDDQVLALVVFKIALASLGLGIVGVSFLPVWGKRNTVKPFAQPVTRQELWLLVVILCIGAVLRFYDLNAGLWHDEILTHVFYMDMPLRTIATSFDSENQHFLYTLLARISVGLFGDTPATFRLPAALFGIGSLWALYVFAREAAGARLALLTTALVAVAYTHIWFSQNARGYSGLLFWTLLSSWLLLRGLRENSGSLWIGYALSIALGLYTHFTMAFVIAGQFTIYGLWQFLRRRQLWPNRWAGLVLGFGLGGLLTLVLYAVVLPHLVQGMGQETSLVAEWKNPLWTALEIVRGIRIGFKGWIVAVPAGAVFVLGLIGLARRRWEVVWLTLVPALIGTAVVVGLGHHLWPRFYFFAMGFGALVAVFGADYLGQTGARFVRLDERRQVAAGTLVCVALVCVAATTVPAAYGPKQDFEGALQFVRANEAPGDHVVTAGLATFTYQRYYGTGWHEVTTLGDLRAVQAKADRVWLIYTFPSVLRSTAPDVLEAVEQEFEVAGNFRSTVGEGEVIVAVWDGSGRASSSN